MSGTLTALREYHKFLESAIIVSTGLIMHLNGISIIELKHTKLPMLTPNAASVLFVFSGLCVLAKLRPLWPNALRKPQRFLIFIVEMALILYAMDFLLRQVWLPSLKLLNFVCHFLGQYVIVANEDFLTNNAPRLSSWIRNDAFYLARFLLAFITFIFMIDTTGMCDLMQCRFMGKYRPPTGGVGLSEYHESDMNYSDMSKMNDELLSRAMLDDDMPGSSSFNVNDLPFVPQEDLLNLGHRVGARRRRNPMRKSKRNAKLLLNDPDNECYC